VASNSNSVGGDVGSAYVQVSSPPVASMSPDADADALTLDGDWANAAVSSDGRDRSRSGSAIVRKVKGYLRAKSTRGDFELTSHTHSQDFDADDYVSDAMSVSDASIGGGDDDDVIDFGDRSSSDDDAHLI
jgi:hypothetical protein